MKENEINDAHVRIPVPQLRPIREMPFYNDMRELLDGCKDRFGEDIAFKIKTKKASGGNPAEYKEVSFIQFRKDIDLLGAALLRLGLKGKRLAIIGKNRYEWIIAFYAQQCGLGIVVPLDKGLPFDELEMSLEKSRSDYLLFDKDHIDLIEKLKGNEKFKDLKYICMDEYEGFISMAALMKESEELGEESIAEFRTLPVDGKALAIILFTSGTSGLAKAVKLTQYNITSNVWSVLCSEDLRHGDVNMAFLPYHHTFGSTGQTMMTYAGMTTVYCDGLKAVQKNMIEYKVSVFICVPLLIEAMYKKILAEVEKQGKTKTFNFGIKLSRFLLKLGIDVRKKLFKEVLDKLGGGLRYIISGASPLDPAVARGFTDLGVQVVQGYGMTEASPVLAGENPEHLRAGTIGLAMPLVELMVEDPNENGEGELIARGPNVMEGYYENPEATAETLREGWLHTGDLVRLDKDGYITVCGRSKNVVVLKNGKNIYPEEIETTVGQLPYVKESMVFGEPREVGGDAKDLVLSIKLVYDENLIKESRGAENAEAAEAAITKDIKKINEGLPRYKQIHRKYITTEEMEKTTTGKVKRYKQKI